MNAALKSIRWEEFERAMRARVAPFDAARTMRWWQRLDHWLNSIPMPPLWALRSAPTVFVLLFLRSNYRNLSDVDASLGAFSLWLLLAAAIRNCMLQDLTASFPEAPLMRMLPIAPSPAFRRVIFLASAGLPFTLVECAAVFLVTILSASKIYWGPLLAMALVQTIFFFALTALFARLRVRFEILFVLSFLEGFLLPMMNGSSFEPIARELVYTINPFGWAHAAFVHFALPDRSSGAWGLVPVGLVLLSLSWSMRGLRERYLRGELKVERSLKFIFEQEEKRDARELILSGDFLPESNWTKAGVIEGALWRRFTGDERRLADVLCRTPLRLSANFVRFLFWFAIFVAATALWPPPKLLKLGMELIASPEGKRVIMAAMFAIFLWGIAILIALLGSLSWTRLLEAGTKPGQRRSPSTGFRMLPVSFWAWGKLILKVESILLLLFVPVAAIFTLTWPGQMLLEMPVGSFIAFKGIVGAWCAITSVLAILLVPGILEGLKYWKYSLATLGILAVTFICMLGFFGAALLPYGWMLGALSTGVVSGWFAWAGNRYRRTLK